ncbi:alginate export family protein [Candidatus Omnitrophota bacterium]
MTQRSALTALVSLSLLAASPAWSSETARRIEEEKRESFDKEIEKNSLEDDRFILDYGGWLNFRYDDFYEPDNDSSTPDLFNYRTALDLRLWLRLSLRPWPEEPLKNNHSFYLRLKDAYTDRHYSSLTTGGGGDHDGPHVDYAYLSLDFEPCRIEAGRRYFSIGRGISYSDVNDGVEVSTAIADLDIAAFFSQTLPHQENIDTSVPGYDKESQRQFYGFQSEYSGISGHRLYTYFLAQRDFSNERPEDTARNYTYDSEYFGIGAEGGFSELDYWVELIRQTGQSRIFATDETRDVEAWGVDTGIRLDVDAYSHPRFSLQYAFGSGDSSRADVANTLNGNLSAKDSNFLYFGYIGTGYALSPRLSNIHLYRLGLECKPLERCSFFKDLSLGINFYRYYKDKSEGAISDLDAAQPSSDIGSEIDLNIDWQIFSDLNLSFEYGHFMPDDAYPGEANDSEDYFSVSTTFQF